MNIYIGNLPPSVDADGLKALFQTFGDIEQAKVIRDRFSGRPKGYGFVDMSSNSDADKAIKALNGTNFAGSTIKVKPADPGGKRKKKRSSRYRRF